MRFKLAAKYRSKTARIFLLFTFQKITFARLYTGFLVLAEKTVNIERAPGASLKISDYAAFTKVRLSLLVLFSAVLGYLMAAPKTDWTQLITLFIGGFFITAASNGLNQVFERDLDKLMKRTMNRPLPTEKMSLTEAWILIAVFAVLGTGILWWGTNPLCALLSFSSLIAYSFIYTPLKRRTPLAVFVGAFPGALPPLLGWVAATGSISYMALLLFATQFMWQFPHFWAIAWRLDDDYRKAGFNLLPFPTGRNKSNAFQILLYTTMLVPVSILPAVFGYINPITGVIVFTCSVLFLIPAIQLYRTCSMKAASLLMFSSFAYLPLVQLALLFNI
jgi:protoheme IX farnesyltransferase